MDHSGPGGDEVYERARGGSERDAGSVPYEEWSKAELYERAQQIGIVGRSSMSKSELIRALRS